MRGYKLVGSVYCSGIFFLYGARLNKRDPGEGGDFNMFAETINP